MSGWGILTGAERTSGKHGSPRAASRRGAVPARRRWLRPRHRLARALPRAGDRPARPLPGPGGAGRRLRHRGELRGDRGGGGAGRAAGARPGRRGGLLRLHLPGLGPGPRAAAGDPRPLISVYSIEIIATCNWTDGWSAAMVETTSSGAGLPPEPSGGPAVRPAPGAPPSRRRRWSMDRTQAPDPAQALAAEWATDPRWRGIRRDVAAGDVLALRTAVQPDPTLARRGAERLWALLSERDHVPVLGALSGLQAVQMVRAGLEAVYLSGWQVAADANLAEQVYPDQSLYPSNSVPALVRRVNHALLRAEQVERVEGGGPSRDWLVPVVADAEAGFGGPLN